MVEFGNDIINEPDQKTEVNRAGSLQPKMHPFGQKHAVVSDAGSNYASNLSSSGRRMTRKERQAKKQQTLI